MIFQPIQEQVVQEMAMKAGFKRALDGETFIGGSKELMKFAMIIANDEAKECAELCLEIAPGEDGQECANAIMARF